MKHPYGAMPNTVLLRAPDYGPGIRALIVMISRGVGPLVPLAEALTVAHHRGAGFALVSGYPAVEAKNIAAELADGIGAALLLIEDDVLADADTWARALQPLTAPLPVRFATARCRDGSMNTRWHADGTPLYSGTPFIFVPHPVLARLPKPAFVANEYGIADGELFLRGPSAKGHHSDVHLWHELRRLDPRPVIEQVGHVSCLVHRLNRDTHDLQTPEVVEVLA